jgi:hypothetical protein
MSANGADRQASIRKNGPLSPTRAERRRTTFRSPLSTVFFNGAALLVDPGRAP